MKNLYILDYYYAINHKEFCIMVESEKKAEEIMHICSSITFLLEDIFDPSVSLDMKCLLDVLVTYYGAVDVKEKYKDILHLVDLPVNIDKNECEKYRIIDFYKNDIYVIDLYEARDRYFYPFHKKGNVKEVMDIHLPKGEDLKRLRILLKNSGVEK